LNGLILNIQRYSIHDGPGIRTVVFLKGCPLRCSWCCNPESQLPFQELEFRGSLCQHFGKCISVCPHNAINPDPFVDDLLKIDRSLCTNCGECTLICPNDALSLAGQWMMPEELLIECLKDKDAFRRSGGGVTISGGEPFVQPDFLKALINLLHQNNVHTAIETCGYADWKVIENIVPFINSFLFDLKIIDPNLHAEFTGVSNSIILSNLIKLAKLTSNIVLRVPLIPGLNDDEKNLRSIARIAIENEITEIHLMPFHQLGKDKYLRFGHPYKISEIVPFPTKLEESKWIETRLRIFTEAGLSTQIGG